MPRQAHRLCQLPQITHSIILLCLWASKYLVHLPRTKTVVKWLQPPRSRVLLREANRRKERGERMEERGGGGGNTGTAAFLFSRFIRLHANRREESFRFEIDDGTSWGPDGSIGDGREGSPADLRAKKPAERKRSWVSLLQRKSRTRRNRSKTKPLQIPKVKFFCWGYETEWVSSIETWPGGGGGSSCGGQRSRPPCGLRSLKRKTSRSQRRCAAFPAGLWRRISRFDRNTLNTLWTNPLKALTQRWDFLCSCRARRRRRHRFQSLAASKGL